jgi:hypothetical protein
MIVVGVKLHGVSDYANNAETVKGHPTEKASFPMLPETVCDGLEQEEIYGERSYDKRFRVGNSWWIHCSEI